MLRTYCDVCNEEIKEVSGNKVDYAYVAEKGEFKAEVIVKKNDTSDGDLCLTCLLNILNTRPKRKYTRKEKQVVNGQQESGT